MRVLLLHGWAPQQLKIFRVPVPAKIICHVPRGKNMAEAITRDMVSSDWLKLATLCLFRAQSVS